MHQDTWNIYTCDSESQHNIPGRGSLLISIPGRLAALHFLRNLVTRKIIFSNIRELLWAERDDVALDQMRVTDYIPITMYMQYNINPALYHYLQQPIPAHYIHYINAHPMDNQPLRNKLTVVRAFQFPIDPFISIHRRSRYIQDISRDDMPTHLLEHDEWTIQLSPPPTYNPNDISQPPRKHFVVHPNKIRSPNPTMRDILAHQIMKQPNFPYSQHERIRIFRTLCDHPNINLDTTIPDRWSHATPSILAP